MNGLADALEEAAGLRGKVRSQIKRAFTASRRPRPISSVRKKKKRKAKFKLAKPPSPFVRAPVEIGDPEA